MTSYLFRLLCLSLASFLVLHSALALLTAVLAPRAMRAAKRMRPDAAARVLFRLRMTPSVLSLLLVLGLVIPSFVMLETDSDNESVGAWCLASAALGGLSLSIPAARACRAGLASMRLGRSWKIAAGRAHIAEAPAPVYMLNEDRPVLALHGIVNPQILISSGIMNALSPEMLAAAMRHESAHCSSHDNLKKLALILAPGVLPFVHGFRALERNWSQAVEWAADDQAGSAIELAGALVRIARMADGPGLPWLTTSLLSHREEFAARVERLLEPRKLPPSSRTSAWLVALPIAAGAALLIRHDALSTVHELLERFIQ